LSEFRHNVEKVERRTIPPQSNSRRATSPLLTAENAFVRCVC